MGYRAREFALRAGVTVRTLHHYDRLGLLKPARSARGHRLYHPRDFGRLQQIVMLKFLGFPLREVRRLAAGSDLRAALGLQLRSLEERRRRLDLVILAVTEARRTLSDRRGVNWDLFVNVIRRVQMQNNHDWMMKYYNEDARKAMAERAHLWSPELQEQVSRQWAELTEDIRQAVARSVAPGSGEGQALAARYWKLIEGFTGGNPAIEKGLRELYANADQWPKEGAEWMKQNNPALDPAVTTFITAAKASMGP